MHAGLRHAISAEVTFPQATWDSCGTELARTPHIALLISTLKGKPKVNKKTRADSMYKTHLSLLQVYAYTMAYSVVDDFGKHATTKQFALHSPVTL